MASNEQQPLLPQDQREVRHDELERRGWIRQTGESTIRTTRSETLRFLTSKTGHYSVLLLVSLDVCCIFADFLISLHLCESKCDRAEGEDAGLIKAQEALGIVSLVFSCLFMAELAASIWAFSFEYFKSWFHLFDATIILAGFIVDVCLKGVLEEVGSTIVVLRLWRVVKIIEELSAGAEDQMEQLTERIELLEREKEELRKQLTVSKANGINES